MLQKHPGEVTTFWGRLGPSRGVSTFWGLAAFQRNSKFWGGFQSSKGCCYLLGDWNILGWLELTGGFGITLRDCGVLGALEPSRGFATF